jgi:hypothetical protein
MEFSGQSCIVLQVLFSSHISLFLFLYVVVCSWLAANKTLFSDIAVSLESS